MDPIQRAWLAGLLEGEGCFHIGWRKNRNGSPRPHVCVVLSMTDEETVRKAGTLIGSGSVRADKRQRARPRWKPSWTWRDGNLETILPLLDQIQPFMSSRRQAKIEEIREISANWNRRGKRTHGTRLTYERGCRCVKCLVAREFDRYFAVS